MIDYTDKSFLDLKFNGHWISEYGLVVTSNGTRYSDNLFADFEHSIQTIPGKNGTIYLGTNLTGRTITRNLATDGMTSRQYASFRSNFKPGTYAEFRLKESEYKFSYAYINENVSFEFLPFDSFVTIAGVQYKEVIYKGECSMTFFFPDPYFYSTYYSGDSYMAEYWFIESGLPLTTWLALEGGNTQLADGQWYGTAPASTAEIKCYHAGNANARANLSFEKIFNVSTISALTDIWVDYSIDDIVITAPRAIQDIYYTYNLAGVYSGTWSTTKSLVLLDLQENLDSGVSATLLKMVLATGTGLKYDDTAALQTAIKTHLLNKTYSFSINGIELQSRMTATIRNDVDAADVEIDENIGDATNNKYIVLDGNAGVSSDGSLTYQLIQSNITLINPEIYFLNTYE